MNARETYPGAGGRAGAGSHLQRWTDSPPRADCSWAANGPGGRFCAVSIGRTADGPPGGVGCATSTRRPENWARDGRTWPEKPGSKELASATWRGERPPNLGAGPARWSQGRNRLFQVACSWQELQAIFPYGPETAGLTREGRPPARGVKPGAGPGARRPAPLPPTQTPRGRVVHSLAIRVISRATAGAWGGLPLGHQFGKTGPWLTARGKSGRVPRQTRAPMKPEPSGAAPPEGRCRIGLRRKRPLRPPLVPPMAPRSEKAVKAVFPKQAPLRAGLAEGSLGRSFDNPWARPCHPFPWRHPPTRDHCAGSLRYGICRWKTFRPYPVRWPRALSLAVPRE